MQVLRANVSGELELSGSSHELVQLANGIRGMRGSFQLDSGVDPAPYNAALSAISLRQAEGRVRVLVSSDHDTLEIQGAPEHLELLAANVEAFASEGDQVAHLHVEYFPGHEYLSQESEPLVIALLGNEG